MFEIVEAKRTSAPITAAIIGGSGSGKTYSALKLARGLVGPKGKIVVIDTEGGRSKIYADDATVAPFYHLDLVPPYTSERFLEAFRAAEKYGADCINIDTISHEHEGFLEFADAEEIRMSARKDKSRSKWIKPKADRKRFYSAIRSSHAHCIVTIRYNRIVDMTKTPPVEIQKPECDKDLPYLLDLSVKIEADHKTTFIKVPEPLKTLVENGVMLDVRHGQALAKDVARQKPDPNASINRTIANLEVAADGGHEILRNAYQAAWLAAGPKGDKQTMTPERKELQKHLERLKAIAATAGQRQREMAEPGDIGNAATPDSAGDGEKATGALFDSDRP